MKNRIDIFRDGVWYSLRLKDRHAIKYNKIGNKIGNQQTREISHTNTFEIPDITENRKALGINVFNAKDLARALNSKYEAQYYIADRLIKVGFVIINNTDKNIRLNFIDGALSIIDFWKKTTHKQLLRDESIIRPTDYQIAIDAMSNYDMIPTGGVPLTPLQLVGSRGYHLALFPNLLNQIGDKFQINLNEVREDDVFIPTQSRPVWNARALFDLAIESFDGYTANYDVSIDWDNVNLSYFTGEKSNEGKQAEDVEVNIVHGQTSIAKEYARTVLRTTDFSGNLSEWATHESWSCYTHQTGVSINGNYWIGKTITNEAGDNDVIGIIPAINYAEGLTAYYDYDEFYNYATIFKPNLDNGNIGVVSWFGTPVVENLSPSQGNTFHELRSHVYALWEGNTANTIVQEELTTFDVVNELNESAVSINKSDFNTPPSNSNGVLIGLVCKLDLQSLVYGVEYGTTAKYKLSITNMHVEETAIPEGEIVFGEGGEYTSPTTDLTHASSDKSIKDILTSLMHKNGILMDINSTTKVVKLFSYGHYEVQRDAGNFYDWSEYFQKNSLIKRNTDYGTNYGKITRIGLSDPYLGNTYDKVLANHLEDSKYKALKEDYVKSLSDVKEIISVGNTNSPYFEYKVEGLSLTEKVNDVSGLEEKTYSGVSKGTSPDLSHLSNVNYFTLVRGVDEWYKLVNEALKITGKFNLPVSVIKTLDITRPIYVNDLQGYYIIEEISQYTDRKKSVDVKLIKLIDNLSLS